MPMKVPNVRAIVVCDEAIPSEEEAEIFTLANARFYAEADSFPHVRPIHLYLLLYCDVAGSFPGVVRVTRAADRRVAHYCRFVALFDDSWEHVALRVEMEGCRFPKLGYYWVEVSFVDVDLMEHARGDSQIYMLGAEENE